MWLRENTDRGKREVERGPVVQMISKLLEGTRCIVGNNEYVFLCNKKAKVGNEEITIYAGPNSHYDMSHDREIYICICSRNKDKISGVQLENMKTNLKSTIGGNDFYKICSSICEKLKSCNENVRLLIFDIEKKCINECIEKGKIWKKGIDNININNATTKDNFKFLNGIEGFTVLFDSAGENNGNEAKK